jgi:hypothetical protein
MIIDIDKHIIKLKTEPSDINEHIGTLINYGRECNHITEFGVRGIVSTWAFLYSKPDILISYDYLSPSNWGANIQDVYDTAQSLRVGFNFIQGDTRIVSIHKTDLLFIDTEHTYEQALCEMILHSKNVSKYIILHDTGWDNGVKEAVDDFIKINPSWKVDKIYYNNNGLTILKRF